MNLLSIHSRIAKDFRNAQERASRNPPRWFNGKKTGANVPGSIRRAADRREASDGLA